MTSPTPESIIENQSATTTYIMDKMREFESEINSSLGRMFRQNSLAEDDIKKLGLKVHVTENEIITLKKEIAELKK